MQKLDIYVPCAMPCGKSLFICAMTFRSSQRQSLMRQKEKGNVTQLLQFQDKARLFTGTTSVKGSRRLTEEREPVPVK